METEKKVPLRKESLDKNTWLYQNPTLIQYEDKIKNKMAVKKVKKKKNKKKLKLLYIVLFCDE